MSYWLDERVFLITVKIPPPLWELKIIAQRLFADPLSAGVLLTFAW
jgi:hypothetical protein